MTKVPLRTNFVKVGEPYNKIFFTIALNIKLHYFEISLLIPVGLRLPDRLLPPPCYGASFGIMCGAFLSPVVHAQRLNVGPEHAACPFCSRPMADHYHVFRYCNRRPNCIRTCQPKALLQRRFGWPANRSDEADMLLLEAMTEVAELVQEHRSKLVPALPLHWQSSITYRPKGFQLLNFYKVKKKPKTRRSRCRVQRQQ